MKRRSEILREIYDAAALRHGGHRGRRGARTTSDNLALPAVGNGVGVLIRPSLTASASLRRCGSAWSLADIPPAEPKFLITKGSQEIIHSDSKNEMEVGQ